MKTRRPHLTTFFVACFMALLFVAMPWFAHATDADLTIEVAGDLKQHGGVVTVYPLPVPADAWPTDPSAKPPFTVRVEARYAEIQLRYPANGRYAYHFQPAGATSAAERQPTQVLTIIGTDEKGHGPQMKAGFADAYSSGGRIIRVPSMAEHAGQDEIVRTNARWGVTVGRNPPPPADERSARVLNVIIDDDMQKPALTCTGSKTVQVCVIPADKWEALTARWWRELAESRLDRMRDRAVARCHAGPPEGSGRCDADPASNEPTFVKRR